MISYTSPLKYFWTEHRDCGVDNRKYIVFGQEYSARTCFDEHVVTTVCACVVELMTGHVAGYTAFVYNFAATPANHGFGQQLMNRVITWCRDKTIHTVSAICLEVNTNEAHLAGFYSQFGFTQESNDYYLVDKEEIIEEVDDSHDVMNQCVSYHSASSSPSARRPSSGFDSVNEETDVRANVAIVDGHDVMTHDNDDDTNDVIFDDTLCEILGASSRVATSLDLDLAFGAVDVNVDLACHSLLSPLSPLPPPFASPPPSAAAGELI